MFEHFTPQIYIEDVFALPVGFLKSKGIKALLLDLDNTLTVWHAEKVPQNILSLLRRWEEQGMKLCLLSNNRGKRVEYMAQLLGIAYVKNANKPSKGGYLRACEKLEVLPAQTAMVGDQLLTDVCGANRAGVYPVLVKPIAKREMRWTMYFSRNVEKLIMPRVMQNLKAAEKASALTYTDNSF